MHDWMKPDTFSVMPVSPWARVAAEQPVHSPKPDFADDESLKQRFGIELAKGKSAFDAGLELFGNETSKALWASLNWVADPIVQASKDSYQQTTISLQKPLDKDDLLAKILSFADERLNGVPLVEAKDRLKALELYAKVSGYIDKIDINASTNINSTTNNLMKIVLVKPEKQDQIEQSLNSKSRIQNEEIPSIPLKLVGGTSR